EPTPVRAGGGHPVLAGAGQPRIVRRRRLPLVNNAVPGEGRSAMCWLRRILMLVTAAALAACAPLVGLSDSATDDREHNRRLLEKWRADPEHYARLLRDL